MSDSTKYCEHCGASMVIYKHSLSLTLVKGLIVLDQMGGNADFSELQKKLTFSQRSNFQKLRYWKLISQVEKGSWYITDFGKEFLSGTISVPKRTTSYRNEFNGFDDTSPMISIFQALGDHSVWYREDYLANREALNG